MESIIIKEANFDTQKVTKISLPQTELWTFLKSPEILFELNQKKKKVLNQFFVS